VTLIQPARPAAPADVSAIALATAEAASCLRQEPALNLIQGYDGLREGWECFAK